MGALRWRVATILAEKKDCVEFHVDPTIDPVRKLEVFLASQDGKAALAFLAATGFVIWLAKANSPHTDFYLTGRGLVRSNRGGLSVVSASSSPKGVIDAADNKDLIEYIRRQLDLSARVVITNRM
ncbi:MAG: hypothetical protein M1170_01540 [Patescibacteria group bacterium]|nr:hypothetical protein [Patescibacteria group bacterium]